MKRLSVLVVSSLFTMMACSGSGTVADDVQTVATVGGCPDGVTAAVSGNVYITDICSGEVIKVNPDGTTNIIVPEGQIQAADGITSATAADGKEILYVTETGTDPESGEIVSDDGSIKKIEVETGTVTEFVDNTVIKNPTGIAADSSGNLYVADQSGAVYKVPVDASGNAGAPVNLTQTLPSGVSIDAPHGLTIAENSDSTVSVYVTDQGAANNNIIKIDVSASASPVITEVTPPTAVSTEEGKFNKPHGIARDKNGAIFVADENNNRVAIITPGGNVVTFAGASDGTAGDGSGDPQTAKLNKPRGMAVDSEDAVLICDYANAKVKKVTK